MSDSNDTHIQDLLDLTPLGVAKAAGLDISPAQAAVLKLGGNEDFTDEELRVLCDLSGVGFVRRLIGAKVRRPYSEIWATLPRRVGKTTRMECCFGVSALLNTKLRRNLAPGERPAVFYSNVIKEKGAQLRNATRGVLDRMGVRYDMRDDAIVLRDVEADFRPMVQNVQHASADSALMLIFDDLAKGQTTEGGAKFDKHFVEESRPMLATTGGMLISFSQAWSTDGYHQETVDRHRGGLDGPILSLSGLSSWAWVPGVITREQCERMSGGDKRAFQRDWLGIPGANEDQLLDQDDIAACTSKGTTVRPYVNGVHYEAACDLGFRHDFSAVAIGHKEERRLPDGSSRHVFIEDELLVWKPSKGRALDPEGVIAEIAARLKARRISRVAIDQYSYDLASSRFLHHGIKTELIKSDIRSQAAEADLFMGKLRSRTIELLDDHEANRELARLRMTMRSNGLFSYAAPQNRFDHDDRAKARFALVARLQNAPISDGDIKTEVFFDHEPGVGMDLRMIAYRERKIGGIVQREMVPPPRGTPGHDQFIIEQIVCHGVRSSPDVDQWISERLGLGATEKDVDALIEQLRADWGTTVGTENEIFVGVTHMSELDRRLARAKPRF